MEFISKITPEKKKKRELKYSLYTNGKAENNIGGWAVIILDKNEQKYVLSGKEDNSNNNRMELYSIVEGLNWIYTSVEPRYRKYISVNLYTDNPYCINIIREWLNKWKDDLNVRPNTDLLMQLLELNTKIKLDTKWIPRVYNEYSWSVDRITNERINEP
jgi:ribonuclease HI